MDFEYDRKFEEMKKYIPFLESMIKRLENTCTSSANPRQAQLDKIRSLRDLLLDKKKRMKMENLLKCEQVLVNLYAKVEQRDSLPGPITPKKVSEVTTVQISESPIKDKTDLDAIRNKLKVVASKAQEESFPETLPEIARASETEVGCTAGSKEPALFQRRPNKASISPSEHSPSKNEKSSKSISKRNYTRVLVSPEPSSRRWSLFENHSSDKKLFTRRSPRRSPRRPSPSYHKKERKKYSNKESQLYSDLNITLKVPEESLNSLNTKDILTRIINCSDNDVDIDTLRELRTQILGELKQTGANEDISDLILRSYKTKKKDKKEKHEVEEGELSDSESETIENIYGSLCISEKDQNKAVSSNQIRPVSETCKQRKIQICLVINSDKEETVNSKTSTESNANVIDISSEFKMYTVSDNGEKDIFESKEETCREKTEHSTGTIPKVSIVEKNTDDAVKVTKVNVDDGLGESNKLDDVNKENEQKSSELNEIKSKSDGSKFEHVNVTLENKCPQKIEDSKEVSPFKANFYKPLTEPEESHLNTLRDDGNENKTCLPHLNKTKVTDSVEKEHGQVDSDVALETRNSTEIPLLNEPSILQVNKPDTVSEIDILQALKNEILSESITMHGTENITPPLHQPKITKVANTQEINVKKRISIEKYKQKSASSSSRTPLFLVDRELKDDNSKKTQSIKLTDKECERFNLGGISLDYSSDDEDKSNVDDIYKDLAPKSPDHDASQGIINSSPVIIPIDPIKTTTIGFKTDVDMRKFVPMLSPVAPLNNMSPSVSFNDTSSASKIELKSDQSKTDMPRLIDPRVRRDINQCVPNENSNQHAVIPEVSAICSTAVINYSSIGSNLHSSSESNNISSNVVPSVTPNIAPIIGTNMGPNQTPNRIHGMTPSHVSFEIDDHNLNRNHVYTSMFGGIYEPRDYREQSINKEIRTTSGYSESNTAEDKSRRDVCDFRDDGYITRWEEQCPRNTTVQRHEEKHQQRYRNEKYQFDKRDDYGTQPLFNETETYFKRSECPTTPHLFSRLDTPMTPVHPFGIAEYPTTPNHPFGRNECPSTPSYSFGRQECPSTPNHPFGMTEHRKTFGRSEPVWEPRTDDFGQNKTSSCFRKSHDPRISKRIDEHKNRDDIRDRNHYKERGMSYCGNSYNSDLHNRTYNRSDLYRNYDREQSVGRTDMRHKQIPRGDSVISRSLSRDYEGDRFHAVENLLNYENVRSYKEVGSRRHFRREQSVGRTTHLEQRTPSYPERSSSRAPSVSRKCHGKTDDKTLSVQSHTGRSFTIDTSVSRTFTFDNNFDIRRKRASSVGRCLTRELSTETNDTKPYNDSTKRNSFRRARSVGRDIVDHRPERTFKDVKADFEAYKFKDKIKHDKDKDRKKKISKDDNDASSNNEDRNFQNRKEKYNKQMDEKLSVNSVKPYSPRKNVRDPRLRREQRKKDSKHDKKSGEFRDKFKYGIVYSNDNIAKGNILGSGYGVKNYKIPKIKRNVEEQSESKIESSNKIQSTEKEKDQLQTENDVNQKSNVEKSDNNLKKDEDKGNPDNKIQTIQVDVGGADNNIDISEKRVTRSSKNRNSIEIKKSMKARKFKKLVYSDSDSEDTIEKKDENDEMPLINESNTMKLTTRKDIMSFEKDVKKKQDDNSSDMSFGIDDSEMFTENNVTDSVINNINALIANLDNDIETHRNIEAVNEFINEVSNENNHISSTEDAEKSTYEDDIRKMTEKDDKNDREAKLKKNNHIEMKVSENVKLDHTLGNNLELKKGELELSSTSNNANNDTIVSTTELGNSNVSVQEHSQIKENDGSSSDVSSIPDSTIDLGKTAWEHPIEEKGLADSTNGISFDVHIDNKSTNDVSDVSTKVSVEPTTSQVGNMSQIDSIGNLLSILQDKSKIKDLLSMLGDNSSENEKIKKKLEKLSDIISDDEDANNDKVDDDDSGETKKTNERDAEESYVNEIKEIQVLENTDVSENKSELQKVISDNNFELSENKKNQQEQNEDRNNEHKQYKEILEEDKKKRLEIENEQINKSLDGETKNVTTVVTKVKKVVNVVTKRRRRITKKCRRKVNKKNIPLEDKRVTRSESAILKLDKPIKKKSSRELQSLQNDIKEMFMHDDILNSTGIRMCRLAKLVTEKDFPQKDDIQKNDTEPIVVLEKFKDAEKSQEANISDNSLKKPKFKPKSKTTASDNSVDKDDKLKTLTKYRPGPKSKTKCTQKQEGKDPYTFEESVSETYTHKTSDNGSDSECDSTTSTRSCESSEALIELKKKSKRKRGRAWQSGIIKPKNKKKKVVLEHTDNRKLESIICSLNSNTTVSEITRNIPDMNCFTDRTYCFSKNVLSYSCRLCEYVGADIVYHYKKNHPHTEIPLSRMSPELAKEAIVQCEEINFQSISKISTEKYICRFCYKEFSQKKAVLEAFFWHVVSMHTGEYKQLCSECINVTRCPFNLDIPPPPKDVKGQLIGYICGKCNFTQISLENLKTHVIVRHNDEQTEVYMINLAVMSKKTMSSLKKRCDLIDHPRLLRSSRSNQSMSDNNSDVTGSSDRLYESESIHQDANLNDLKRTSIETVAKHEDVQLKFTFETDDNISEILNTNTASTKNLIKFEREEGEDNLEQTLPIDNVVNEKDSVDHISESGANERDEMSDNVSDDVMIYPHFKINYTESGSKAYICCINGRDNHYKTTLLISLKKHVEIKHTEAWDGYCCICKVIVTSQGTHSFKECLQHYLDNHMDNFPILENVVNEKLLEKETQSTSDAPVDNISSTKTYISVRPLDKLMAKANDDQILKENTLTLPKIQSVVSLGPSTNDTMVPNIHCNPEFDTVVTENLRPCTESIAEIMAKKHRVVLETMMIPGKLVQIFKCAGRFCSFTTDSLEDSLRHASTHQRVGGENALKCTYCDFDCSGNGIDLAMHVFKTHSRCPYVCSQCFYRAASSQLVGAHMAQTHGQTLTKVLRSTVVTPSVNEDSADLLKREAAVTHYVCAHVDLETQQGCKFRTYTAGKFCEHLTTRHSNAVMHPCFICSDVVMHPKGLIHHLRTHGFKLYQCTWCVHGADSEAEMLTHAANSHPHKQPQAYLRIITVKEGSTELRVLPLAHLNKYNIPTEEVIPNANCENPVREAERSMELEKLINETILMIESTVTESSAEMQSSAITNNRDENINSVVPDDLQVETSQEKSIQALLQSEQLHDDSIKSLNSVSHTILSSPTCSQSDPKLTSPLTSLDRARTPPLAIITQSSTNTMHDKNLPLPVISVLKTEPSEESPVKDTLKNPNIVYCLDSDEEDSRQGIIELSDEDNTAAQVSEPKKLDNGIRVAIHELFKCSHCSTITRNMGGFKRHIISCFPYATDVIACAHCNFNTNKKNELFVHYTSDHGKLNRYMCGVCNHRDISLPEIKKHLKQKHATSKLLVKSSFGEDGDIQYVVLPEESKPTRQPKRKLSGSSTINNTVSMPKQKRYGPQEVDQLPINPILDESVYCSLCEFNTKVRLNMVRHLQLHAEKQPVPETVPVNPVPHLETNEKHFDKMVNLASSSLITSAPGKLSKMETTPTVTLQIPPEAASRYPKYVPERQRHTCGAKGCSYISVDEAMLRCHWETLHSGTNSFHCVHCPPYQHLDTTKPLTAARVLAHLKMHDVRLYACSNCSYYHYKREVLEKHLAEIHKEKDGQVMVVREEVSNSMSPATTSGQITNVAAPTMDLKPWQCGLCKFKSMLRPEVIEHCAKSHQSKMQFKCAYCPFRTSTLENVTKHQSSSHPTKQGELFYFYYREGSVPDETDGTPRWVKQREKTGLVDPDIKIKTQPIDNTLDTQTDFSSTPLTATSATPVRVDLNLVKKEVIETELNFESIEDLCKKFGQFCDPSGLKYKCSLCKIVIEDSKEAMQSHLFEELQYRKWGCTMCPYKAFHAAGLNDHMKTEHGRIADPIDLPLDNKIEMWVAKLLEHQDTVILKNKENLAKQRILTQKTTTLPSTSKRQETLESSDGKKYTMKELELAFGQLGVPDNMKFCCPKCSIKHKDEAIMKEHLESELTRIRWGCSNCPVNFHTYHEAQFHCKSLHAGQSARPKEIMRDPVMRAAWVAAVIRVQKLSMNYMPVSDAIFATSESETHENEPLSSDAENSLLVVRYEEKVDTPEEQSLVRQKKKASGQDDSDDDRLVIDEPSDTNRVAKKKITGQGEKKCPYCDFMSKYNNSMHDHILRHYNLKPFMCSYCDFSSYRPAVLSHIVTVHPNKMSSLKRVDIPTGPPPLLVLSSPNINSNSNNTKKKVIQTNHEIDLEKVVCLICEKYLTEIEVHSHVHENIVPQFGKKGDLVVKCCICLTLVTDVSALQEHHKACHSDTDAVNYAFYKLCFDKRELHYCSHCKSRFTFVRDLKTHHNAVHSYLPLKYTSKPFNLVTNDERDDNVECGIKRKREDNIVQSSSKKTARKSTTKLPTVLSVARKSTTKLPFHRDVKQDGYSFYGTNPIPIADFGNITTLMPFCNTMMPFTLEKLSEIIEINPIVYVEDIKKRRDTSDV